MMSVDETLMCSFQGGIIVTLRSVVWVYVEFRAQSCVPRRKRKALLGVSALRRLRASAERRADRGCMRSCVPTSSVRSRCGANECGAWDRRRSVPWLTGSIIEDFTYTLGCAHARSQPRAVRAHGTREITRTACAIWNAPGCFCSALPKCATYAVHVAGCGEVALYNKEKSEMRR